MSGVGLSDILLPSEYKLILIKGESFLDVDKLKNFHPEYLESIKEFIDIPRTITDLLNNKYIEDWEWSNDDNYLFQMDFLTINPCYYVKLNINDIPLECFNRKYGWYEIKEKLLKNKEEKMLASEVRVGDRLYKGGNVISVNKIEEGNIISILTDNGTNLLYNAHCGEIDAYHTENSIPLHGEKCLVSDGHDYMEERIFLYQDNSGTYAVSNSDEQNYYNEEPYDVIRWEDCKLLPKSKPIKNTFDISITMNGEPMKLADISEEVLVKIYRNVFNL